MITVTLDWLATQIPKPDLIKIDAEGADFRVLQGAAQLLREQRPFVIFEGNDEFAKEASAFLSRQGYVFDADQPPQSRSALSRVVWSTLAVPASKAGMFASA